MNQLRIERLLLENIASFKGKTEIHFDEISNQSDLFAITGPTGSGKSTILTSISMALFGVHPRGLNSADIISMGKANGRIECDFHCKGIRYTAEWTCSVLKKNGEPRKTPLITRLLLDGHGAIEETIENLIGLTFDQFSKVVILNQGQFSTFLTSSFTERKDLLEKLLEHHDLKVLARFLKTKISTLEKEKENGKVLTESMKFLQEDEVKQKEKQCDHLTSENIRAEKFLNKLDIIQSRLKNNNEGQIKKNEIHQKIKNVTKEADLLSIEVNSKKAPLEDKKKEILKLKDTLKKETPLIEEGIFILQKNENLLNEQGLQNQQLTNETKRYEALENNRKELENKRIAILAEWEESQKLTKNLTSEFFENIIQLKRKLKDSQKTLGEIEEQKAFLEEKLKTIETSGNEAKKKQEELDSWFIEFDLDPNQIEKEIESLRENLQKKSKIEQNLNFIEERTSQAKKDSEDIQRKLKQADKQVEQKEREIKEHKIELKTLEDQFVKNEQIIKKEKILRELLKTHLEEDKNKQDCPVCDSPLSHEKKEDLLELLHSPKLSEELSKIEKLQIKIEDIKKALYLKEDQVTESLTQKNSLLSDLENKNQVLDNLIEEEKTFCSQKQELSYLEKMDFSQLSLKEKEMRENLFCLQDSRKRWAEAKEEAKKYQQKEKAVLDGEKEITKLLKEAISGEEYLLEQDEETLTKLSKRAQNQKYLVKEMASIDENLKRMTETFSEIKTTTENVKERLKEIENLVTKNNQTFKDKKIPNNPSQYKKNLENLILTKEETIVDDEKNLAELDLNLEKKKTIIRTLKEQLDEQVKLLVFYRSELLKELTDFKNELAGTQYYSLKTETHKQLLPYFEKIDFTLQQKEGSDPLSREILEQFSTDYLDSILSIEKSSLAEKKEEVIILQTQLRENQKQREKIQEKAKELEKVEAELSRLNFLAPFILKDNFRDFALEVLEETLLDLANQEIDSLADGRYQLVHGKAGKKSELIVIDHWQSQSKRKVSTLSGGETFLLSLGLALGLSELTRGQTEVECFFIDEGFGTLDEESISQVLDCLMHIQSRGKQIGLISHVKLLTNQIPVRIELDKNHFGEATLNLN